MKGEFLRDVVRQEERPIGSGESITVDVLSCGHAVRALARSLSWANADTNGAIDPTPRESKRRTCQSCALLSAKKGGA
jgi:hypothetical protein